MTIPKARQHWEGSTPCPGEGAAEAQLRTWDALPEGMDLLCGRSSFQEASVFPEDGVGHVQAERSKWPGT